MIKVHQIDPTDGSVVKTYVMPSRGSILFYIKCMGKSLPETEIFDEACKNEEIFFSGTHYHKTLEELKTEMGI